MSRSAGSDEKGRFDEILLDEISVSVEICSQLAIEQTRRAQKKLAKVAILAKFGQGC